MADTLDQLQKCISEIKDWMGNNFLRLNDDKTEVLLLGSKHALSKLPNLSVTIGETDIVTVPEVRNLGAIIDNMLNMKRHIKQVCHGAW